MHKVLVAGATGYPGKFIIREFEKRGYWVRALVRNQYLKKLEEAAAFFITASQFDFDAPKTGNHMLKAFYEESLTQLKEETNNGQGN